jgi:hypothetical protein
MKWQIGSLEYFGFKTTCVLHSMKKHTKFSIVRGENWYFHRNRKELSSSQLLGSQVIFKGWEQFLSWLNQNISSDVIVPLRPVSRLTKHNIYYGIQVKCIHFYRTSISSRKNDFLTFQYNKIIQLFITTIVSRLKHALRISNGFLTPLSVTNCWSVSLQNIVFHSVLRFSQNQVLCEKSAESSPFLWHTTSNWAEIFFKYTRHCWSVYIFSFKKYCSVNFVAGVLKFVLTGKEVFFTVRFVFWLFYSREAG